MGVKAKVESDISSTWVHRDFNLLFTFSSDKDQGQKVTFAFACDQYKLALSLNYFSPGLLGIIWYCLWLFIVAESPAEHSTITKEELEYIQNSIGFTDEQVKVN